MKKKLIFNLIVLALVVTAVIVFLLPLWDSVKATKKRIENSQAKLESINKLLDKTKILKDDYEQVKSQAEKVFISLPKEKDLPDLIVQFENLAVTHGLVMESIGFGELEGEQKTSQAAVSFTEEEGLEGESPRAAIQTETTIKPIFRSLPVTLSVSGDYSSLKKYISGLETNIRSMNIQRLNLGSASGEGGESSAGKDSFTFDLEVSVYYQ